VAAPKEQEMVTVKLDFNGEHDISAIYKEMQKMFDQVAPAYKGKTNRTETDIKYSLRVANQVIYREARIKAPRIRPDIHARQSKEKQEIHLSDKKYMVERSAAGKKFRSQGIVARRVVTFKDPVSKYVAAVEYGRDSFIQVMKKKPYGVKGGDTSFWLRKVGAMKAQPFLRKSQNNKAQIAYNTFTETLSKRWLTTLKRVAKHNKNKGK